MKSALTNTALALKFALELAALAALAFWGSTVGPLALNVLLGVSAPLAVAVAWGRLAAPRSATRLARGPRVAFELAVFAVAGAALAGAGEPLLGAVLLVVALIVELLLER